MLKYRDFPEAEDPHFSIVQCETFFFMEFRQKHELKLMFFLKNSVSTKSHILLGKVFSEYSAYNPMCKQI